MSGRKKARDAALGRVGRALYGPLWIGELETKEWEQARDHDQGDASVTLPAKALKAAEIAKACFRRRGQEVQFDQVITWLHEQGIDCIPDTFDALAFEKWFQRMFSSPMKATARRQAVVRAMLDNGETPGRGGSIRWKTFYDKVRKESGHNWDELTIKRTVQSLSK